MDMALLGCHIDFIVSVAITTLSAQVQTQKYNMGEVVGADYVADGWGHDPLASLPYYPLPIPSSSNIISIAYSSTICKLHSPDHENGEQRPLCFCLN